MSLYHYFVLLTLSLMFIIAAIMAFHYKGRLIGMSGMMLSMVIGTTVGLTAGVLFGSLNQGNLFYSTAYSILIGVLVGTICGSILGILPALEGFLAGLMGGMMAYNPSEVILKKGTAVTLILNNVDSIDHDIEIKDIPIEGKVTENHGDHLNKDVDFHLHAPAKKQNKLTFIPLKTGTFQFYCTIPGHKEKGMTGLLIIT